MKRGICLITALLGLLCSISCNDDDLKDTSLLVGVWNVRSVYVYKEDVEDKEYKYNPGDFFYRFDGVYFTIGGMVINCIDVKRRYVYDESNQTITIEEDEVYKVLQLTQNDLILESNENTDEGSIRSKTVFTRQL